MAISKKRPLHKIRRKVQEKLEADPNNQKLIARKEKLDQRIYKGNDRPNENVAQRQRRLQARLDSGKGDSENLARRIRELEGKKKPRRPRQTVEPKKPQMQRPESKKVVAY